MEEVRLSEVVGALSEALDVTEGQPSGHAQRSCVVGMRLAEALGLDEDARSALFYALLLKDAGCSTTASRVAALFGHDDAAVKAARRSVDDTRPGGLLRFAARTVRPGAPPAVRLRQLTLLLRDVRGTQRELTRLRCERGAQIALEIGVGEATAGAIATSDEHWDGRGRPDGLVGEEVPLLGRVVGLAQAVEVFFARGGPAAALAVARGRRGTWFDPALADALAAAGRAPGFWAGLDGDLDALVARHEPPDRVARADDAQLDRIAQAFARVVDAKSPYTARHSDGVADIALAIAGHLGFGSAALRDLHRAALLHDLGKLGVPNTVLDKPGPLDDGEWRLVRRHPALTQRLLGRVRAFAPIASDAAAHHERLDGRGYHRGLRGEQLTPIARVLAVADVAEALSATRPYRRALPSDEVLSILRADAGHGLWADAVAAYEELDRPLAPSVHGGDAGSSTP